MGRAAADPEMGLPEPSVSSTPLVTGASSGIGAAIATRARLARARA